MKIVCDKCQTKYSIADEKVSGKVFKIRCKKCSHIIVVKGNEGAAEAGPASDGDEGATVAGSADAPLGAMAAATAGADKVWYLVVAGEQVGPFSVAEVRTRHAAGEVDGETYAWREGFGDWLRLSTIDDFRDLGAAAAAVQNGAANGGDTRRTDLGDMFSQHQQREEEDGGASDIFGRGGAPKAAAAARGDNLFGAAPTVVPGANDDHGRGGFGGGAAAASASNDSKLTGQRNENSVLFSLSNLSAMATAGNAKPSSSSSAQQPQERPGYASARNEGSGLIDIRAMAAATLSSAGSSSGPSDSAVDIPSFSAAPVFTPVVAAPVMMPAVQSGMPGWAKALIAVGGVVVLGMGGLVVALLTHKPDAPPQVAMANPVPAAAPVGANALAAQPSPGVGTPVAAGGAAAAPAAETAKPVAAPAAAVAETAKPAETAKSAKGAAGKHGGAAAPAAKHGGASAPIAAAPTKAAEPVKAAPPPPAPAAASSKKKGNDSLDDLLNDAAPTAKKSRPAAAAEAAPSADDANLPEQLDRSDVLAGMKAIQPKVMGCYAQYHVPGVAMVSLTIGKNGHISAASVGGALSGTPTGDCVAKAVKSASFKRFKGAAMSIQYPFQLR